MTGTKKQKMNMSNAIVEAIYSMDPPGRFLKKCPSTGQWKELSKKDAADRVAQAMAYSVRGKEKSKQRREERRRSLRRKSQGDDLDAKSSQGAAQPIHPQQHVTNNHSGGDVSTYEVQGHSPRRGAAAGTSSGVPSAREQLRVPGNSNLQQQLLQQLQQSSSNNTTLPTTLGNSIDQNVNQNGLAQLLLQTLQQQQQIPLQYTFGQNPLGQLLQYPLQPALQHEGLTQLLAQAQQQQQQHNAQEQLILQHLLNQQNVLSSASLTPSISSLSAPYMTGTQPQPQPANINLLQTLQQQSNPPNVLLLSSVLSNLQRQPNPTAAISNAPQEVQQLDHLQRSLMLQQNQLLASSLSASSNNQLPSQQQQLQLLDPLLQQTMQATLQLQQNSQGVPPPSINLAGLASANIAAQSTRQEGREDEEQGEPEEDCSADD